LTVARFIDTTLERMARPRLAGAGVSRVASRASYLLHRAAHEWRKGQFPPGAKIDPTRCAVFGNATVAFGRRSYAEGLSVYGWGHQEVEIGAFCSIADRVCFVVGGHHDLHHVSTSPFLGAWAGDGDPSAGPIRLGNDVWIGHGATVMGGVSLGNGSVVAAGAVVTGDVCSYDVVAGVPARRLRRRFDDETCAALERTRWWDLPDSTIEQLAIAGRFADPRRLTDALLHRTDAGG
jgi:acetyltransferase-like isoleucine patch superfamily enzyme